MNNKPLRANPASLLPIGVFLVLYLGLGILFEYILKIPMGFYNIPIVVVFLVALLVACLQNRALSFDEKLTLMGQGIGDKNIVTMILIFMEAGIFVGVVGRGSAESVAYFMLSIIPARYAVAVLFVVSCFVSTAMGTSVGTITLITPIAVAAADASGFSLPLCIGSVMGGAMFGDNLSFISDTTIAACNGQGCEMKDKFRENFAIALPAALVTLVLILVLSMRANIGTMELKDYSLIQIIPYLLVLLGGLVGVNVFVVLLVGIVSGAIIMLATGAIPATDLLSSMGAGAAGARHGPARRRDGHRHGEQHRRHRHGKPDRRADGRALRHLEAQDRFSARHLLLRVPGHHPLRRADARRPLSGKRDGPRRLRFRRDSESVLSVPASRKLARVHLSRPREESKIIQLPVPRKCAGRAFFAQNRFTLRATGAKMKWISTQG